MRLGIRIGPGLLGRRGGARAKAGPALALAATLPWLLGAGAGAPAVFTTTADGYAFDQTVDVRGTPDCILGLLLPFEHLRRFAAGPWELTLVAEGDGWNEVRYHSHGWFYDVEQTYRRRRDDAERRIVFTMTACTQSGLVPRTLSSDGEYVVREADGGSQLRYTQRVRLGQGGPRGLYLRRARSEAERFMKELRDYVDATCP